ncbi:zinc metallopeptidase [Lapidilactobacillus gannanensis]|jgi:Zn-dependent membrane protease YugP|uniref:Zinc metallopeptidase n=1 Tax=Lapidilactobacillus gannanensis TaxID=2486002 RepID=A0ABW4BKY6_9LACO|nr:zinc metallopeptidase [Lapidilactobacillus gannanensis]MCH4057864.1 zinc metallopeptidase [Lactobacillaceae bacterium]
MMFFYFDPTFILVIIGIIITGIASAKVNGTFRKYDQIQSENHLSGAQAAAQILAAEGITDVTIREVSGHLTDNYNSGNKTLSLSEATYQSTSVAAIGVAAHEVGHALQHHQGYLPLRIRSGIFPLVNIGSTISFPLIIVGMLLSWNQTLINIGIWCFALVLIFQLVTLPVEFNASGRALRILSQDGLLTANEVPMVRQVLSAAAMTYVAAVLSSLLQLLRLVILFGGNRNRD